MKSLDLILELCLNFTDENIKFSFILIYKGRNIGLLGVFEILLLYLLSLILYLLIILICDFFRLIIDFLFASIFSLDNLGFFLFLLHFDLILHSDKSLFHNIHLFSAFDLSRLELNL